MKGGGPGKPCGGRKPERVNVGYVVVSSISNHKPRSRQMGPNHSAAGNLKTSWDKSPHYEAHFHTSKDTPGRLRAALPAGPSGRHGLTIHAEGANPSRPMQPRGVEAVRRDAFFLPWEQVLETRRMPSTSGHGREPAQDQLLQRLLRQWFPTLPKKPLGFGGTPGDGRQVMRFRAAE